MPATLPAEILFMIIDNVSSMSDIRSIRAVNRAFCAYATPAAFHTVGATNLPDSALGLVRLLKSDLGEHVHEVVYRDAAGSDDDQGLEAEDAAHLECPPPLDANYGPSVQEPLVHAFSLTGQLPQLTTLRFIFHPRIPWDMVEPYGSQAVEARDACSRLQIALLQTLDGTAPRLRVLTLRNIAHIAYHLYRSAAFRAAISSLTHLCISTASHTPFVGYGGYPFWVDVIKDMIIQKASSLVSLSLAGDSLSLNCILVHVSSMPQLEYLTLNTSRTASILRPGSVETFVGQHPMLERIDMCHGTHKMRWTRETPPGSLDALNVD
ncbi:hypothetical protein FA95DRAFT_1610529 [Auriscalpium vulgare]|uniref:Uncharacterized protein n=1 Tax=Auriscalpium vulgare TaxID=40419 RepID=A0ACB8REB3_9AGAM|nr:hypothetical protein FA95DRAFT_1610529 [Auriscalpium vulgare]